MALRIVAGMRIRLSVSSMPVVLVAVSLCWMLGAAARGSDLEAEYAQVRKIALKDPKVQEAYDKANDRLNQRILEIDPSLKPIVDRQTQAPTPVPAPFLAKRRVAVAHPAIAPVAAGREHVVLSGETLDSIAHHYRVRVATLERVNHITDARKLRVGQKLVIPGPEVSTVSETAVAAPAPSATPLPSAQPTRLESGDTESKDGGTLWDKLKGGL
jgi:LysM repeat protein